MAPSRSDGTRHPRRFRPLGFLASFSKFQSGLNADYLEKLVSGIPVARVLLSCVRRTVDRVRRRGRICMHGDEYISNPCAIGLAVVYWFIGMGHAVGADGRGRLTIRVAGCSGGSYGSGNRPTPTFKIAHRGILQ